MRGLKFAFPGISVYVPCFELGIRYRQHHLPQILTFGRGGGINVAYHSRCVERERSPA